MSKMQKVAERLRDRADERRAHAVQLHARAATQRATAARDGTGLVDQATEGRRRHEGAAADRAKAEAGRAITTHARHLAAGARRRLEEVGAISPADRDRAADKRSLSAAERDAEADERDRLADEREHLANDREHLANERESRANERERLAEARDQAAAERDQAADERDQAADERDRAAKPGQNPGR